MEKKPRQRIHFLRTPDGVQLAWAEAGAGPPLIKASNWLSHLEYEWESPVWRHRIRFFSDHFRFVRYDERGCGMSDWNVGDLSFPRWVSDLEAVADAALPQSAFPLVGISQGAATSIAYAVKHPERVSRLLLYGGYARGWALGGDSAGKREYEAIVALAAPGWGRDNPAFRQVFTSRFIPGATSQQMDWFNELCRRTSSPAVAADLLRARAQVDVKDLLAKVHTPTLVVHAREDAVVPVAAGRQIAALIPGGRVHRAGFEEPHPARGRARLGETPPIYSTSSACGRAPRRSSSRAIGVSRPDRTGRRAVCATLLPVRPPSRLESAGGGVAP
jgi:pimeloyl-ACP methyl ester carboxylesterase